MKIERDALLSMAAGPARTKLLGAFYTPDVTASALANWAIRSGDERILEPSAGDGALIRAALQRSDTFETAGSNFVAVDIDPTAVESLKIQALPRTVVKEADFLAQTSEECGSFDVVLANPPFNRNHSIPDSQRRELKQRFAVEGAAGLWVYFLIHSLEFLRFDGRLAFVVPRSAAFTKHGDALLRRICNCFASVGIYELSSRPIWSAPADECGAVILAEGFRRGEAQNYVRGVIGADGEIKTRAEVASPSFDRISQCSTQLCELASIAIGAVTGRNKVFLLSDEERRLAGIDMLDIVPVVSRSAHVLGISTPTKELLRLSEAGHKTLLLHPRRLTKKIENYLSVISEHDRNNVVWFKKRTPWWRVQLDPQYDGVFTCMNHAGPRVTLLGSGAACTNTLHRIAFNDGIASLSKRAAAMTVLSTYGQLAAEKLGRVYGGGVLKFEIAEARKIPVLAAHEMFTPELMKSVDRAMREGSPARARDLVDLAFMPKLFGQRWRNALDDLQAELRDLRSARQNIPSKGTSDE